MENEEKKAVLKLKLIEILKGLGVFLVFLLGYLFIPLIVALIFYQLFGLSLNTSSFIGNVSYALVLIAIFYGMFKDKIKDYISNFSNYFKMIMKSWGLGLLVMYIANIFLALVLFSGEIAANEAQNRTSITGNLIIGFMSIVFLAPLIEEMIFRFGLRKITGRNDYFPLLSAIVFGFAHILAGFSSPFGYSDLLQFLYLIPYGALGYAFGYIYNKTDNIYTSMTAHAIHNLLCFIVIATV